jgi:hypothetical protein
MKWIIGLVCVLFLMGCGNSKEITVSPLEHTFYTTTNASLYIVALRPDGNNIYFNGIANGLEVQGWYNNSFSNFGGDFVNISPGSGMNYGARFIVNEDQTITAWIGKDSLPVILFRRF